jgi:WD40 repeat protein
MKKIRILIVAFLFGAIFPGLACDLVRETVHPPPGVQSTTASPISTVSPAPTSLISTPRPSPTAAALLTGISPTNPTAPTRTSAPFLPADLAVISPQNVSKLKPVAVLPEQGASVVAYSPDSSRVAAGLFGSKHVKIWDLANGQELFTLSGHADPRIISYLTFSPDGSSLASGAQGWDVQNDSLILWDTGSGRELQRFSGVLGAISPDWRLAALTRRKQDQGVTLVLSDLTSGKVIHNLKAPGDIYGVSFSPQGQRVAAKMYDIYQDLFSFWLVDSGQHDLTMYDWVGFSYSPDGRFIAALLENGSSDKGDLNIFDGDTFGWIKTLAKDADSLWYVYPAFSPDGQVLAASFGDHVILWETQDWKELASLPVSSHTGLAFSPDGRIITTFTHSGLVQLWGAHLR